MSPGIILIIWLDRGPGFHRIPSPAIAANELHNQRCNRILFEAGATVLIESVTCQRTTPRQISICRAVAVRVNVRATNANFPAIRNRQLPLINVLYITKSKSNKLVTRLLVYTKPTYNPSLYIPLMNPPFPFIYYPRFDFRSKITSLNSLRLNLLESFLVVARLPDRLLAIRDTTNHHPCLIGGEPREADLLHGSNTRRNSTPPEDGGFGLASPSCLCFLHLGKGEEGRNWRRYANNSRNAIAQDSEASGLRTCRGYVARALGSADTRLCGPARSAPLPGLLPYHGCGGSLECGSHIRHSATTGVTSH